jgi:hypothetical protein
MTGNSESHRSYGGNLLAQLTYKPHQDEETTSRFAGAEVRGEGSDEEGRDQAGEDALADVATRRSDTSQCPSLRGAVPYGHSEPLP